MDLKRTRAQLRWIVHCTRRARPWTRAINRVAPVQDEILRSLLRRNADSEFGREHSFGRIGNVAEFQGRVPVQTYESIAPYIERITNGKSRVLTCEAVQRFGRTSGSTCASKLVPYTASLVAEFQEGIFPWMYRLMRTHPRICTGPAYWSITPIGECDEATVGGIPIGFADDRSYFGVHAADMLRCIVATPSELSRIGDVDAFRYATLRFLLQERSLSWVSIWNPTFATLLLDSFAGLRESLIRDIHDGSLSANLGIAPIINSTIRSSLRASPARARELAAIPADDPDQFQRIWPNLRLISCWTHGRAREAVATLQQRVPQARVEPKGLIATEAFVSFPFQGDDSALAITAHFFEFMSVSDGSIKLAHQLEVGEHYAVIVTTGGGLYRYQLHDVIEVTGFTKECPLLRFVRRADSVVDMCGEKMNENFVRNTIEEILVRNRLIPNFWMVAPERNGSRAGIAYTLFLQFVRRSDIVPGGFGAIAQELDSAFRKNVHYDYCRRLGQLDPCSIFVISETDDAAQTYILACSARGQRLGDVKTVALHSFDRWSTVFKGSFVR